MQVLGVRLKKAGRILFFEPNEEEIMKGDSVIVETERGLELGKVVIGLRDLPVSDEVEAENAIKKIHRKATEEDLIKLEENRAAEKFAFEICQQKIAEHELPMKLINVEYIFDVNKIIFFFTADGRVDFRGLVRDLAAIFRTRIELRQVGVRDEAKLLGGMGGCGRPLCCATFLGEFVPVSIRMAKDQNLSLNPTKISGVCGRLMCCLKYENDLYCENCPRTNIIFKPRQGSRVIVAEGEGKVVSIGFSRRNATILLDTNKTIVASWEDILPVDVDEFESIEGSEQIEESVIVEDTKTVEIVEEIAQNNQDKGEKERPRRAESLNRRYNRAEKPDNDDRAKKTIKMREDRGQRAKRPRKK